MKFTQLPSDTHQRLQLNAGIIIDGFTPATGTIGNIIGATSGGMQFNSNPEFQDFGEDIDNCPDNTYQLKRITGYNPQMSGTFLTCTPSVAKKLIGGADIDSLDSTHVIPRHELLAADFTDIWWVGDYSDINKDQAKSGTQTNDGHAGFLAIHLKKGFNTSGFQIQSTKKAKGQMSFEFHGHYDLSNTEDVPFELYVSAGAAAS